MRMPEVIQNCLLLITIAVALSACSRPRSFTISDMAGVYDLYVGSPYENRHQPEDRMTLLPDSSYVQVYRSAEGALETRRGRWAIDKNHLLLSTWTDHIGLSTPSGRSIRVVDIAGMIEPSNPPIIVLDNDSNIFYSKYPQNGIK